MTDSVTRPMLPIDKIFPDKAQPREYFAADKMLQVRESLAKEGMTTPIDVMDNEDGTYLIIDGERRYRAATELLQSLVGERCPLPSTQR